MDNDILGQLEEENTQLRSKNLEMNSALSASTYKGNEDNNLIQYQIETGEMLEKIEHFLKGERLATDEDGSEGWTGPKKTIQVELEDGTIEEREVLNETLVLFNEYGVNSIMSIIGNYIDKNTILSFYDEMRINEILADLAEELAKFIYCNYEKMGMDTEFKKTRFPLSVLTIIHAIESAYRRAMKGKTFEDINSSRIYTQNDSINSNRSMGKKKFHLFKPNTW